MGRMRTTAVHETSGLATRQSGQSLRSGREARKSLGAYLQAGQTGCKMRLGLSLGERL